MGQGCVERDAGRLHAQHGAWSCLNCDVRSERPLDLPVQHDDLYEILYNKAIELGAEIQYDAHVVDIDVESQQVTLQNGKTVSGDVIVGADGEFGVSRETVVGTPAHGHPTGVAMYE